MNLGADIEEIAGRARDLAAQLEPIAAEADASSSPHPRVRELLAASGLTALTVPGAWGGAAEKVDPIAVCRVREILMGTCSHADSLFALSCASAGCRGWPRWTPSRRWR